MIPFLKKRSSGILLHISSLPSPCGIGDLGPGAWTFLDFLSAAGQSFWQILPLGPTSPVFGNSPYMSSSAFAGNPLFISPELLAKEGLLTNTQLSRCPSCSEYFVAFDSAIPWKNQVLQEAWTTFLQQGRRDELDEISERYPWLKDHALFMALKEQHNQLPWWQWPTPLRKRDPVALQSIQTQLHHSIDYFRFEQYVFFRQWQELRRRAAKKNIRLIGDLPIYVALDSVDVWAHQEIFDLDPKTSLPTHVAGVPPDYFSRTGQLWGNPLYRWNSRKKEVRAALYDWWTRRLETIFSQVDIIRIDHFRGFDSYWSVPAREKTAIHGNWKKGPGLSFFREMEKRLGPLPVIAEDLGLITPAVEKLRDTLGFPGMKILLFAFDGNPQNSYLPYNHPRNSVVYTGTHDNDTAVGWFLSPAVPPEAKRQAKQFANRTDTDASTFHQDMIHLALGSPASLALIPMQDVLGFGNDCRMNTPGTSRDNWRWRCAPRFMTTELALWMREKTALFGRLPENQEHQDND
ncbi:4-alpha-glucanotransferase [Desulfolithobacter dissulfuricans]|uniref:4-alpha-glucanotransferase n=1 Tax=Desulfolithobacter dissulfuricans TaxID=2795293 RepID=A0A915U5U5_9BACT|nr:4-alpha-glucanotransferase [Desulfolithobacter dissulfuricans]BCO09517.1 4-alpha-glucanotransferase [Desulfolithobacter dissulfuricans]